jgi:hypothetical protein
MGGDSEQWVAGQVDASFINWAFGMLFLLLLDY